VIPAVTIQPDDLIALLSGIGGTAGLMRFASWTSDRRLARAQTVDTEASAGQRISQAAAVLVEQTGSLLPALTREVAELRGEVRAQAAELAQARSDRDVERESIGRLWMWLEDHQRWDLDALDEIRKLGGTFAPPSPPPARRPAAVNAV